MRNVLTKAGYEKLTKKLEELRARKVELVKEMELARQEGDLAENSAYHQLRETVTIVTQQIEQLDSKLDGAVVAKNNNKNKIGVGSCVVVAVNGEKRELQVVGDGETDPLNGKVSHQSPIGSALMGKKVGNVVSIETPGGVVKYNVLEIK